MQGMNEVFRSSGLEVRLQVEYLDTKRYHDPYYLADLLEKTLKYKLRGRSFDLVLLSDDSAIDFALEHRNDMFAGTPIVFCGANDFKPEMIAGVEDITGVGEYSSVQETINQILRMHPQTTELVVIGNTRNITDRLLKKRLLSFVPKFEDNLKFSYWDNLDLHDLSTRISQLKPGQVILFNSVVTYEAGGVLMLSESAPRLRRVSTVPMYSLWHFALGKGIVGGMLVNSKRQGELAAQLAVRVLQGENPKAIPAILSGTNEFMFDYNELKAFNIPLSLLPEGSTVINLPSSFYQVNKRLLWTAIGIALLLVLGLLVLLANIASRQRAETALRQALLDAEISRNRISAILKSVADGLMVTDLKNQITLLNRKAENLLGIRFEEIEQKPVEDVLEKGTLLSQLTATPAEETHNELIKQETFEQGCKIERYVQAITSPVISREGETTGRITLLRDMTREKEIDRMKNEFISTAAHELRTPLTSVKGFAELLLNQPDVTPENQLKYLSIINDNADLLDKIVTDLLDLSRINTGQGVVLNRQPCSIHELLDAWVKTVKKQHMNRRIEVTLDNHEIATDLDRNKIVQVLENLFSNAVKFSAAESPIRLKGQNKGAYYKISIEDEGIGMTADQIERIFDKFYRVDSSDTALEGLGLGMSIAKTIVEAHGGQIWATSEKGKGTTVSFALPMPGISRSES